MKRWGWGGGMNSTSGVTGSRYRWPFTVRIRCRHQLITVVQLDGGQTRSCRWGWSCNIKVSLETRDFCVRNKGLWRVKPRSSGGKRPDFRMRKKGFFSYLSCLCRFKGVQGNEPIYILLMRISSWKHLQILDLKVCNSVNYLIILFCNLLENQ